jgi:hypothetical protein
MHAERTCSHIWIACMTHLMRLTIGRLTQSLGLLMVSAMSEYDRCNINLKQARSLPIVTRRVNAGLSIHSHGGMHNVWQVMSTMGLPRWL